ncbi:putative glycosyltransferase like family [Trypoxylus dichotomus]
MTSSNSSVLKDNFKLIEIPLNKFHTEALPYHLQLYQQQKDTIERCMSTKNSQQLSYEIKNKPRIVRQLKDLLYELDTLRTRVYDEDLDKFDSRTFSLRKSITTLIKDYGALESSALNFLESQNEINENIENESPFHAADQIQISANLDELCLEESANTLGRVEALNRDIENLHGIYVDLNTMVSGQKEAVNTIETDVAKAEGDVKEGLSHLIKAHKLKSATYPISGAVIGGLVGGPIGLVAGFKVGGLAALGCGIAGYTGGKLYKNYNTDAAQSQSTEDGDIKTAEENEPETDIKKDV